MRGRRARRSRHKDREGKQHFEEIAWNKNNTRLKLFYPELVPVLNRAGM